MATIINNSDTVLSVEAQREIQNAAADLNLAEVYAVRTSIYADGEIYEVYDENDNYLFSVDSPDGVVFEK